MNHNVYRVDKTSNSGSNEESIIRPPSPLQGSPTIKMRSDEGEAEASEHTFLSRPQLASDRNTKSKTFMMQEKELMHDESGALIDVMHAGVGTADLAELTSDNTLRR